MVKIKWFEKYGLGPIEILNTNEDLTMTRYRVSTKLFEEIKSFAKLKNAIATEDFFNIRTANAGKSMTFSTKSAYGVAGVFSSLSTTSRENYMKLFSKYIESKYK